MTSYKPGQVVLIPFPFTDLSTNKQRPGVVISSVPFNRSHPDVIIAAITSHLSSKPARDEHQLNETEQQSAGLPKPSTVKLGKIVTLDQRLIRRSLGQLPPASTRGILDGIKQILSDSP
jgi:mRNA interferase MazF